MGYRSLTVAALYMFCAVLAAQPPVAFDVSVIKPADLTNPQRGISIARGNRSVAIYGLTAGELIQRIYAVQESQIVGGPPWMESGSDRFDITAKIETDTPPSTDQLWVMLQRLLADRFALKFHRETKMRQGYALVPGKTGPKLGEAAGAVPNLMANRGQLQASHVSMSMFINFLSRYLGRPIFDGTGLGGSYDFKMTWTPGETEQALPAGDNAAAVDSAATSIFSALQDQLGLKLESKTVPIEVFVIDHVERPSEN
jgi:uncharacterized protein (TIGR03435 family)